MALPATVFDWRIMPPAPKPLSSTCHFTSRPAPRRANNLLPTEKADGRRAAMGERRPVPAAERTSERQVAVERRVIG